MKIIHCVTDAVFIDGVIQSFNDVLGAEHNKYVCFPEQKTGFSIRYAKRGNQIVVSNRNSALEYVHQENPDVLILHNLSSFPIEQLSKVRKGIKVVWFAWGYDLYSPFKGHKPFIPVNLHHTLTQKAYDKDYRNRLRLSLKYFRWHCLGYDRIVEEGINRIDYFSGVIPWEYEMMRSNRFFRAQKVDFSYCENSNEACQENLNDLAFTGNNILVGNSDTYTNNHLDVFEELKKQDIKDKKVIVPLNYGGPKRYRDEVLAVGKAYFKDQFVPITDFMPLNEYNQLLASCRYSIFCLERQQAVGNIRVALWNGHTIFLSKTSPLYNHFKQQGYRVFSIQDDLHLISSDHLLSDKEIIANRKIRLSNDAREVHYAKIKKLYNLLASEKI